MLTSPQLQMMSKLLTVLLAATAIATRGAAEFIISPAGTALNPGAKSKPFASLGRARDEVREQKRRKPNQDFKVFLRGGVYELKETVVFSLQDSATAGHTITYGAYPGETPVLSSGASLRNWKRLVQEPESLPS